MKTNQLKIGVILSYVSQGIHMLSALIYTPIMLRLLGQSEYGLYQLVYSVVSYLGVLSFGFGSSYVRFFSKYKASKDKAGIAKLNGMFMTIFSCIAAIVIVVGVFLVVNVKTVFGEGLSNSELKTAQVLLVFMIFNMAITFLNSVFDCNVTANEHFFFQRILIIMQNVLNPFISIPVMLLGYGSIGVVCIVTLLTMAKFVMNIWFCFKKLHIEFDFNKFDFALLKEMWGFTFFIFLNSIIDQVNWNVDKFLLGRYIGTTAVAVYGIAGQINSLYIQLSTSISSVFIPRVNKLVVEEKDDIRINELFVKIGRIQLWVLLLILSGVILFGEKFIEFWAGKGYEEAYAILIILMIPGLIPQIQNIGIEIQRAKNKHKARSIVYFVIAIINIFISIPLIKRFGASGAAMGTAVALIAGNMFMNYYYYKAIGLDIVNFWKNIISAIPAFVLAFVSGVIINYFVDIKSFVALFGCCCIYTCLYFVLIYLFGINKYEKNMIINILKK